MSEYVRFEMAAGIATVTIDNPPLNVLSSKVVQGLDETFSRLADDPEAVVVILTSAGNKAFMAGADIKEFPSWLDDPGMKEIVRKNHDVLNMIDFFPKPTIALLNGMALGGGCELALTCDIRIAEEHVRIGLPEIKLGIFPGGGGTQRLPRVIGASRAKEMMLTGESLSADEALQIGLVNKVVPSGKGMEEAQVLAGKIACHSLKALSSIKQAVSFGQNHSFEQGIAHELDLFANIFTTADAREGIHAFIEKRAPIFKHK